MFKAQREWARQKEVARAQTEKAAGDAVSRAVSAAKHAAAFASRSTRGTDDEASWHERVKNIQDRKKRIFLAQDKAGQEVISKLHGTIEEAIHRVNNTYTDSVKHSDRTNRSSEQAEDALEDPAR